MGVSMSSQDSAYGITTGQIVIGATTRIGITAGPNVNTQMLIQVSGGTLWILGASMTVLAGATRGYPFAGLPVTIGGQAPIHIIETAGVTSVIAFVKTLNSPSEF